MGKRTIKSCTVQRGRLKFVLTYFWDKLNFYMALCTPVGRWQGSVGGPESDSNTSLSDIGGCRNVAFAVQAC